MENIVVQHFVLVEHTFQKFDQSQKNPDF